VYPSVYLVIVDMRELRELCGISVCLSVYLVIFDMRELGELCSLSSFISLGDTGN
jgi:hypothetical protein